MPAEVCGATVRLGAATAPPEPVADAILWSGQARLLADRRHARLDMVDVGRFAIMDGNEIVVEPARGADHRDLTAVLYGTATALLLAQRGQFALHASTVAVTAVGVALAGRSGAGKSTAALALEQRGHRLVTDDVSPVRWVPPDRGTPGDRSAGARRTPEVLPFGRPWHVWPDTATALGLDLTGLDRVDPRQTKLSLPGRPAAAVPLRAAVVLRSDPAARHVTTSRLTGPAAVHALLGNAYRVRILGRLWAAHLFSWAAELADRLPVWSVARPGGAAARAESVAASAGEVAAAIESVADRVLGGRATDAPAAVP
jgi:HPr Serine kinase C-terminal domain